VPEKLSPTEFADYLLDIGGTLVSYGCPSYRLEEVIRVVADLAGRSPEEFRKELAGRFDLSWRGLARYWRKKGGPAG